MSFCRLHNTNHTMVLYTKLDVDSVVVSFSTSVPCLLCRVSQGPGVGPLQTHIHTSAADQGFFGAYDAAVQQPPQVYALGIAVATAGCNQQLKSCCCCVVYCRTGRRGSTSFNLVVLCPRIVCHLDLQYVLQRIVSAKCSCCRPPMLTSGAVHTAQCPVTATLSSQLPQRRLLLSMTQTLLHIQRTGNLWKAEHPQLK